MTVKKAHYIISIFYKLFTLNTFLKMLLILLCFGANSRNHKMHPTKEYKALLKQINRPQIADKEENQKQEFTEKIKTLQHILDQRDLRKEIRIIVDSHFHKINLTPNLIKKITKVQSLPAEINKIESQMKRVKLLTKDNKSRIKKKKNAKETKQIKKALKSKDNAPKDQKPQKKPKPKPPPDE
ncbi:hypothetical protein TRFO_34732 [Tritrichomonas foetus]|uniref:Uncharacterized protein n=1 Tax=Tritrichomonas foetus TaxID=1144522 RepID=A0A1J4JNT8_9EUKA|nr:hypothetical protein TRFO_34732 [Tritrichomonas foetus]|eukprot:OHS98932.1 hypothetical protein TRFO_34732 [Tritrichomonas foetus]